MRGVHVLVAPDAFGSSLTAAQAAAVVAQAWRETVPSDEVEVCPLADGGPGFVETLHGVLGGDLVPVTVSSPDGQEVPAAVLVTEGAAGGRTAYVESAHAAGTALVPAERRDPVSASSRGVGQLLAAALSTGARRVVVGLGGTVTNDAGAGMLAALAEALDVGLGAAALSSGGGALGRVTADDLAGLRTLRARLAGVDLVGAADVDIPLLGLQGASAASVEQRGATQAQAQELEQVLGRFAHAAATALGDAVRPDLLAASHQPAAARLAGLPGAGAGGGLGYGLALVGGRLLPGARLVADAVGLDDRLADADVVLTGEGRFDVHSLHGKAAAEVASRALAHGVPTVVLAGEVLVGRRELLAAGISAAYAVAESPTEVEAALAAPAQSLAARARRVARTWSR